jgi:toxin ParE1/3/4
MLAGSCGNIAATGASRSSNSWMSRPCRRATPSARRRAPSSTVISLAIQDVQAIRAYISRDSRHYAALVIGKLIAAVDRLADFPLSGRVVPELIDETIREVIVGTYRVVYRVTSQEVQILIDQGESWGGSG